MTEHPESDPAPDANTDEPEGDTPPPPPTPQELLEQQRKQVEQERAARQEGSGEDAGDD